MPPSTTAPRLAPARGALSLPLFAAVAALALPSLAAAQSTAPASVPVVAAASPSTLLSRDAIAASWAPTFFQETDDTRDLFTAFDFDGDWDGSNNAAHVPHRLGEGPYALRAVVYYTALETATHWLLTYVPYHPVDGKSPFGHDHDTEHVTVVVRKGPGGGTLELVETRFHHELFQYVPRGVAIRAGADDVDGPAHLDERGRPAVYIQRVGHGICGGFSPPTLVRTLALYCDHDAAPHVGGRGVVYRFAGQARVPRSLDDRDVGYALVDLGPTLWRRALSPDGVGPHATFAATTTFGGARCSLYRCPSQFGGPLAPAKGHDTTGMPWDEGSGKGGTATGEAFFDPAFTLARRLRMTTPFSTEYAYNPYLGVGSFVGGEPASARGP